MISSSFGLQFLAAWDKQAFLSFMNFIWIFIMSGWMRARWCSCLAYPHEAGFFELFASQVSIRNFVLLFEGVCIIAVHNALIGVFLCFHIPSFSFIFFIFFHLFPLFLSFVLCSLAFWSSQRKFRQVKSSRFVHFSLCLTLSNFSWMLQCFVL